MSKRYLITQSLLNSWLYQYDAYNQDEAEADFLRTLSREPEEPNEAMQNGIEFERLVTEYCLTGQADPKNKWAKCIAEVGDTVKGGCFQVAACKEKTIGGIDFLLYGRLDVLRAGIIFDIKFSKSYESGKYFSSPQHPMYFECVPEAKKFIYVVSNGHDVFKEPYTRDYTPDIDDTVKQFVEYLEDAGLLQKYFELWPSLGG